MIHVDNVTKWYGPTLAVDRVSFDVGVGEIVGFLGPNGAGKSTVLKMISTWLPPASGRIAVGGHDVEREPLAVRRALGYLPEHNALYDGMKVAAFLRFVGGARGLAGGRLDERLERTVDGCGVRPVLGKRIHECSKGYRQRIGLAAALIHDPPVIVLDEPTHGFDPIQVVAFRTFIRGLREGRTILFSSHILSEVTAVSDRILVINEGRILVDSPVEELNGRARAAGGTLEDLLLEIVKTSGARPQEVRS
jgi:ABC-2 type transport system ATP-binding protein